MHIYVCWCCPNLIGFGGNIAIGQDFGEDLRAQIRHSKLFGDFWNSRQNYDSNSIEMRTYWNINMSENFYPSIGIASSYSWPYFSKSISNWRVTPNFQLNFKADN